MEDNPADVRVVQEMVRDTEMDVEVAIAKDGEQAISLLEEWDKRPDLVLVDLKLPRLDGFDLLRLIRQNDIMIKKVVVLTGSIYDGDRKDAHRLGVDAFLVKPASMPEFDRTTGILKEIMRSL